MTNDAKLGMLAGVVGVLLAAVFLAKPGEQPGPTEPQPQAQAHPAALPSVPVSAPNPGAVAQAEPKPPAFPSTPVGRARKEVAAQPAGRHASADEEP